jgi:Flp pilus assembly protein TadG
VTPDSIFSHSNVLGRPRPPGVHHACLRESGSQIVEFALSVPLLVLFVIGIYDFSGALALKHKLTNAVREGARVAAADPATDLNASMPVSVSDAFQAVDNYLLSEQVNDCGLSSAAAPAPSTLTWVYQASSGCPGASNPALTLTINRGCISKQTMTVGGNTAPVDIVGTCVTLSYPYVWQFNTAAGLFSRFSGPTKITTTAIAFDEN